MNKLFGERKHIHLIGIGGSSMVAVAQILVSQGYKVSGSDSAPSDNVSHLIEKGININIGHHKNNIDGADLIIHTGAVHEDNVEIIEARKNNIEVIKRNVFFQKLTKNYKKSIAVSGAHGKTTVTSMISVMLDKTDFDPTLIVGARVNELNGNVKIGKGDFIVNEACEFEASFLDFYHSIAIILNIDDDHLDYYQNMDNLKKTFLEFANNTYEEGLVVINKDDKNSSDLIPKINRKLVTFSVSDKTADYYAENIHYIKTGFPSFDVINNGKNLGRVNLSVPGFFNIKNALAAIAAVHFYVEDISNLFDRLSVFRGAIRRFEYHGILNGALLFDDFAHHPNEIENMLEAARNVFPDKKIYIGFQPHTYSRTKNLFDKFLKCFKLADHLYIMDIYAAREIDDGSIHSIDLIKKSKNPPAVYTKDFEDLREAMIKDLKKGDVFFSVGCGDVYRIFSFLKEKDGFIKRSNK